MMTLAYLGTGIDGIILIVIGLIVLIALGNYGRDTQLGYGGSILLSIFTTPLIGFVVIYWLRRRLAS